MADDGNVTHGPDLGRLVPVKLNCAIHEGISEDGDLYEVPMSKTIDTQYLSLSIANAHALPKTLMPSIDSVIHTFRALDTQLNQDEEDRHVLDPGSLARSRTGAMAWAGLLSKAHTSYRLPQKVEEEHDFAAVYHESIHSPALFTLLQLEHTYGINVAELIDQRNRSLELLSAQHQKELDGATSGKKPMSDIDLTRLAHRQARAMAQKKEAFRQDIAQLKAMQKHDYHEYVRQLFHAEKSAPTTDSPNRYARRSSEEDTNKNEDNRSGSSMLKRAGGLFRNRLSTSAQESDNRSLLSSREASAVSPFSVPLEESFTVHLGTQKKTSHNLRLKAANVIDVCKRIPTADFDETQAERLGTAMNLYSTNQLKGIIHLVDNNITRDPEDFSRICETTTEFHFDSFEEQIDQLRADIRNQSSNDVRPDGELILETGDVYVTKHSNLSGYHVVFHLVVNRETQEGDLNTRSPVVAGLRAALRTCFQFGVTEVSVPLLMVDHLTEEMTPKWQSRRAELILKCAKGFILENSVSGNYQSKTVEFLVPAETDMELFDGFSRMLSDIFRVAGTMNLSAG